MDMATEFYTAVKSGNPANISNLFGRFNDDFIIEGDAYGKEEGTQYYNGVMCAIAGGLRRCYTTHTQLLENDNLHYDWIMIPKWRSDPGLVVNIGYVEDGKDLKSAADQALANARSLDLVNYLKTYAFSVYEIGIACTMNDAEALIARH